MSSIHAALRAATHDDHAAVDQSMAEFNLTRPADYRAFLSVHRAALSFFEPNWRLEDRADLTALRRCLDEDLETFAVGRADPPAPAPLEVLSTGGRLGVAYVIRGSRLGSAVLRRRVPGRFSTSYLDFMPAVSWKQFLNELAQAALPLDADWQADVIAGAHATFCVFREFSERRRTVYGSPA